ncbi:MAG: universal stress protein [Psychromonas sp.]
MSKILVILEQQQQRKSTLDKAIELAKKSGADIHVLIYCYEDLSWMNDIFDMLENQRIKEQLIQTKETWWQQYIKTYDNKVRITHEIVWDKYFVDAILNHCKDHSYDFYMKKGHRSESLLHTPSDWLLLRESEIPSYIVAEESVTTSGKSVLLALDLMARSQEKQNLNRKLLAFGYDFAKKSALDIHCCFAISVPNLLADFGHNETQQYAKQIEEIAKVNATPLLNQFNIPAENLHLNIGEPNTVIDQVAQKVDANIIIIGSMCKKRLTGKVIGNTCEEVLHITHKDMIVLGL